MTHTPEPWALLTFEAHGGYGGLDPDGNPWPVGYITEVGGLPILEVTSVCVASTADVELCRRIVAAINATAGIPTDALEAGVVRELREENARLRQQIADLHNTINTVGSAYDKAVKACDEMVADVRRRTRAMLTKAGAA